MFNRHVVDIDHGWQLEVADLQPEQAARAIVVLGHAMMVDRRPYLRTDRPTLAETLRGAGCRVLVPDLRGRGLSGPGAAAGGSWSYDDLVEDVGRYVELARSLEPSVPLILAGHSLFGHNSLAYLGTHPDVVVEGVVLLAVSIWNRRWDAMPHRWWRKRAMIEAVGVLTALRGYVPVRHLGLGSTDESDMYWRSFIDWVRRDRWGSLTGVDYAAAMASISCPVLHVASQGDRLFARPGDARNFTAALGARREFVEIDAVDTGTDGVWCPDHMGLVLDPRAEPIWKRVATWIVALTEESRRNGDGALSEAT